MNNKILLVTQPSCGGAERMTILYGKILEKAGFSIDVFMISQKGKPDQLSSFIPSNWHVHNEVCKYRYFIFKLWDHIKKTKPSTVFTANGNSSNIILILKTFRLIKAKVIIRDSNMPSTHDKNHIQIAKLLYRHADSLIAQTSEMKEEMVKYYNLSKDQVIVINNPVDGDLIQKKIKEEIEIDKGFVNYMACSRIFPQKDIATMLNAFAIVKEKIENARLYIIGRFGTDDYMKSLYDIIESKSLQGDVLFLGFKDNPYKYLIHADVFVLSSIYEGLPNVMLEAMYLGKPVAATHCIPYIKQVIKNGHNGYTCEICNPYKLAECMINAKKIKGLPMFMDVNKSNEQVIRIFS